MPFVSGVLRRLLRRAGILAFAVLVGGAVGLVANARAQPAPDGIQPGRSIRVVHNVDVVGYRTGDPVRIVA